MGQGDDYFLEDSNAKFYQTPVNGTKAMVGTRDAGLRGNVERVGIPGESLAKPTTKDSFTCKK